ncbi:MAG TPA: peptidoglycan-associated lipoprotein Pal, partial [Gemmatimonadales bacterium]|nr:peptidoglycan-associated lipoprotein Pal [Gemmatimonadales bacterium]
ARITGMVMDAMRTMIHFDFDKSDIRPEDRATLDQKVAILRLNPALQIRISGNCDERGSDEYNLALGSRRAAAAKTYLTNQGIDPSRIDVISYGEERPLDAGHDETAWAANRRDEFEVTAGGTNLMMP